MSKRTHETDGGRTGFGPAGIEAGAATHAAMEKE